MPGQRTTDIELPNDTGEVDPRIVKQNRETERVGRLWMKQRTGVAPALTRQQGKDAVDTAREQRKKWPKRQAGRATNR